MFSLECRAEKTLVIVAQHDSDVSYRKTCVEEVMNRQFHAIIKKILEDSGSKFLLEGFLQGAFVCSHHCRQLVERRHFLIVGEDDALGIVYLVTDAEAEGLGAWQETGGQEKAREAVDNLRFQVFGGLVA